MAVRRRGLSGAARSLLLPLALLAISSNFLFLFYALQPRQPCDITNANSAPQPEGAQSRPQQEGEQQPLAQHAAVSVAPVAVPVVQRKAVGFTVQAYSSRLYAWVAVDNIKVFETRHSAGDEEMRGIHATVLHGETGHVTAQRHFDTYLPDAETRLAEFINSIHVGRIIALCIRDEGSFNLKETGRNAIERLGATRVKDLQWRGMWAMVARIGQPASAKDALRASPSLEDWGEPVLAEAYFDRAAHQRCAWASLPEFAQRAKFCDAYDGYGALCHCTDYLALDVPAPDPTLFSNLATVPVVVVASENRPQYLFRALRSLLSAKGARRENIVVYIDGVTKREALDVCSLLGVKGEAQEPHGIKNARISQHYLAALSSAFDSYPEAGHVIVTEEDLDVAPDFYGYFSQTLPLLEADPTLYCVSAWNDQGYKHSSADSTLLYRVETMPGLGWLSSRNLFKNELQSKWPSADKLWDWDMWMRMPQQRRERECIIPDVSRTFHFGATGLNVYDYFQTMYFAKHAINTIPNVVLQTAHTDAVGYDAHLHALLESASVLRGELQDPCELSNIKNMPGSTLALYIQMTNAGDFETWLALAKCWKIWDIDVRGFHKSVWRIFLEGKHLIVVGSISEFSRHRPVRRNEVDKAQRGSNFCEANKRLRVNEKGSELDQLIRGGERLIFVVNLAYFPFSPSLSLFSLCLTYSFLSHSLFSFLQDDVVPLRKEKAK